MTDPNLEMLASAARVLEPLLDELVFLGGCTTGLMITDPAAAGIRATKDVDAIAEVASYARYDALSERLRALKLREDTSEGAPLCRWRYEHLIVDVMPIDSAVLGFTNRWYPAAMSSAQRVTVGGLQVRVVTPVYFIATKLEAFRGRGNNDFAGSHDLEDVVTVIDGRHEVVAELTAADEDVRSYIGEQFSALLRKGAFVDSLPGLLLPDAANQARLPLLLERLRLIATG